LDYEGYAKLFQLVCSIPFASGVDARVELLEVVLNRRQVRRGVAEKVVVVDHDRCGLPRLIVRRCDGSDDASTTCHFGASGRSGHRRQLEPQLDVALDRKEIVSSEEDAGRRNVFGRAATPSTLPDTPVAHGKMKGESGRPHE
jgi:hypothetical protein